MTLKSRRQSCSPVSSICRETLEIPFTHLDFGTDREHPFYQAQYFSAEDAENLWQSLRPQVSSLCSFRKLPCLSATVFEPQRHREHRGGNTRIRPGADASRCAILVREQRKSRRMHAEFQIWLTAFPLLPDENGGRRRPRAGLGIPVYLCVSAPLWFIIISF